MYNNIQTNRDDLIVVKNDIKWLKKNYWIILTAAIGTFLLIVAKMYMGV